MQIFDPQLLKLAYVTYVLLHPERIELVTESWLGWLMGYLRIPYLILGHTVFLTKWAHVIESPDYKYVKQLLDWDKAAILQRIRQHERYGTLGFWWRWNVAWKLKEWWS